MKRKKIKTEHLLGFSLKEGKSSKKREYQNLEAESWQEYLFSPLKESEKEEVKVNTWRFVPFFLILVFSFLFLGTKSWQVQGIEGEKNLILSEGNRIRVKNEPSARGVIYDRAEVVLARNGPGLRLLALPGLIEDVKKTARVLGEILNEDPEEIEEKIEGGRKENPFLEITLKSNISHEIQLEILAREDLAGIKIDEDIIRDYPEGNFFSTVIGYTGEIAQEELLKPEFAAYTFGDFIGRSGIENYYEKELKGIRGKRLVEVDALGREERILAEDDSKPGNGLVLSIDAELQKKTHEYLEEGIKEFKATGGAVVIQKTDTGEILALISLPSFDNNLFAKGISEEMFDSLINDPQKPLFNRAIVGTYPCGSTIKPMVAVSALQEGVITRQTKITDKGAIDIGSYHFPCWVESWGLSPHGSINVVEAIAESCDVFFYTIGGGYGSQSGLGPDLMKEYALKFGLGSKTGIDLPGEEKGFYPSPEWKLEEKGDPWYLGDTYWISIGQSYVLTTPLQVTNMINTVANGGKLFKPFLVKDILGIEGEKIFSYQPEIIREGFIDQEYLAMAREGMRKSVSEGIIWPLRESKTSVAAKTGTAEFGEKDEKGYYKTHAWVTGFAPYENPEISFTFFLETGGKSNNAAEVARKVIDWYFTERGSN